MKTLALVVYRLCSLCGSRGHCAFDCMHAEALQTALDREPESRRDVAGKDGASWR